MWLPRMDGGEGQWGSRGILIWARPKEWGVLELLGGMGVCLLSMGMVHWWGEGEQSRTWESGLVRGGGFRGNMEGRGSKRVR